jgi:hypothetical protein
LWRRRLRRPGGKRDQFGPGGKRDQWAYVGEDFSVPVRDFFSDPNGDPLSFVATGQPASVVLSSSGVAAGKLVDNDIGNYTVRVTATDPGGLSWQITFALTVNAANTPPVVNAGADRNVTSGDIVFLTAEASDTDEGRLSYQWTQTAGPKLMLLDATSPQAMLIAPYTGDQSYAFELSVTDQGDLTTTDSTVLNVSYELVACEVSAPPAELGFDPFHQKYCDANGIPVSASAQVDDLALQNVTLETKQIMSMRPDLLRQTVENSLRVIIKAEEEVLTDIPEYSDLYERFPDTLDFDAYAGIGATFALPISSTSEENAMCADHPRDFYHADYGLHIHEFTHSLENLGLRFVDPTWNDRRDETYNAAMADGLWAYTYANTNSKEYLAEGAVSFFNARLDQIATREHLRSYDSGLANLLAEFLPEIDVWMCR